MADYQNYETKAAQLTAEQEKLNQNFLSDDEKILYQNDPLLANHISAYRFIHNQQVEKSQALNKKVTNAGNLRLLKSALDDAKEAGKNFSIPNDQMQMLVNAAENVGLSIPYKLNADGDLAKDSDNHPYIAHADLEAFSKRVAAHIKNAAEFTKMEQMNMQQLMNQASTYLQMLGSIMKTQQEMRQSLLSITRH